MIKTITRLAITTAVVSMAMVSFAKAEQTTVERYQEAYKAFGSQDASHVVKSPSVRPDGKVYHVYGEIEHAEGETAFIARSYGSIYGVRGLYAVKIPSQLRSRYVESASIGRVISVIGYYKANRQVMMVNGSSRTIPVFEAAYIEF